MRTPQASGRQTSKADPDRPRVAGRRTADSANRAYRAIHKMIVDFQLRPQQRINEVQLARELNLSRTPIREALNRLASEGFLIVKPNLGFFFRALEIDDLLQLFELRTVIETGGLMLACERAKDEDITKIEEFWKVAQTRYRVHDPDEILSLDEQFHLQLMALSGNDELLRTLESINARIRFVRRTQISLGKYQSKLVDEHTELLHAVRARDRSRCEQLLRDHVDMTFEDARSALKEALFHAYMSEPRSAVGEEEA
jgi:Transcriptional regulators